MGVCCNYCCLFESFTWFYTLYITFVLKLNTYTESTKKWSDENKRKYECIEKSKSWHLLPPPPPPPKKKKKKKKKHFFFHHMPPISENVQILGKGGGDCTLLNALSNIDLHFTPSTPWAIHLSKTLRSESIENESQFHAINNKEKATT